MWFLHTDETDGVQITHCRKGHEYRQPELPRFSVDGYSPETNTLYESLAVFGRVFRAGQSGMSPSLAVIPWSCDMKAPCSV